MSLQEQTTASVKSPSSHSLLDEIMAQTRIMPSEEGYDIAKMGVAIFIEKLIGSNRVDELINKSLVDQMIVELDKKISAQMDAILHCEPLQTMESAWRGLKLLVDRTDFGENIKIDLLQICKDELLDDFELSLETTQSGLYKHIYSSGYGQFGGEPIGAIIANYDFLPTSVDMKLLQYVGAVGAMAHAPFISAVSPAFFGLDSFETLPNISDLSAIFEGPRYTKWRSLRDSEDARYIGLTAPRFLLRTPYDPEDNPIKTFNYRESVSGSHDHYLWGNSAFALATRFTESFAKYRWCPNIIGPQSGGEVADLPIHLYESFGVLQAKIPTEILITDRREFELAEAGFISLTMRKGSDNATFFSANSIQKPKRFPATEEGKMAQTNYKLGTQLPYLMIINRLAHYIKVLQREQIGAWKERQDLERELTKWIRQYIADQENPPSDIRSRRPLRGAKIEVSDIEGDPGWYQVTLSVRPHFKYMGANFELSLVGRLDQA